MRTENDMATQAQLDAGFAAAKTAIVALVKAKVPSWAQGMISITDDEIRDVSDPIVVAADNARATASQTPKES
jgi:hypothetical protein